ncbi:MAG: mechanosensitive ion channel family protein [Bacteroidales bacterium]
MKVKLVSLFILFQIALSAGKAQMINVANQIKQGGNESTATQPVNTSNDSLLQIVRGLQLQLDSFKQDANNKVIADVQARLSQSNDSAKAIQQIDSLKKSIKPAPVVINNDTILELYASLGGKSAMARAQDAEESINNVTKDYNFNADSLYIVTGKYVTDIMYKDNSIFSFTETDALFAGMTKTELGQLLLTEIQAQSLELSKAHGFFAQVKRIVLFILIIIAQIVLCYLIIRAFRFFRVRVDLLRDKKLKPIILKDYELVNVDNEVKLIRILLHGVQYFVIALFLILTVPLLFWLFPQTKEIATDLLTYILFPIKQLWHGIVNNIPNFITIIVIVIVIKYLVRAIEYIGGEVASERLKISGFYPDWAMPTANIIKWLLYAFSIAIIYPLIPGGQSDIFKGVSVLLGVIVSLGSSSVVGNIMAGLVITYMRAFKIGDRIKLNDTIGNVIEKSAFVTRIKTPKNEVITIPNSFILSSQTTNYSHSARRFGLIIHTSVTIGYDAPWRKVHQLLIDAAKATPEVLPDPEPFVLETSLDDYYVSYQINAYIQDADNQPKIMSKLHANIQDMFNHAGVEIMSPHYRANRNGNAVTIPEDDLSGWKESDTDNKMSDSKSPEKPVSEPQTAPKAPEQQTSDQTTGDNTKTEKPATE